MQLHLALGRQRRVIILDEQHKVHLSLSQEDACRALLLYRPLLDIVRGLVDESPEAIEIDRLRELARSVLSRLED